MSEAVELVSRQAPDALGGAISLRWGRAGGDLPLDIDAQSRSDQD